MSTMALAAAIAASGSVAAHLVTPAAMYALPVVQAAQQQRLAALLARPVASPATVAASSVALQERPALQGRPL